MVESQQEMPRTIGTLQATSIDWSAVGAILVAYFTTRVMIFLIIFVSSISIPMRPGSFLYSNPDQLILDGLVRDDSWWYVNIVNNGYSIGDVATHTQGNAVFFPLYPLAIRLVADLTGSVFAIRLRR